MPIRDDVLTCLRERLMNQGPAGRIFADEEDYQKWLLGHREDPTSGFLNDPVEAMARDIGSSRKGAIHCGIDILPHEIEEMVEMVSRFENPIRRSKTILSGNTSYFGGIAVLLSLLAQTGGY